MSLKSSLVGLLLSTQVVAQGITLVEGPNPTSLDVRVMDESQLANSGTLLLQGIEILPIEMSCRVKSQELQTDRARVDNRNGLPRIELPGANRIFQYRRQGGAFWGYLLVPASGLARVIVELPGRGVGGLETPFGDRISVNPTGRVAFIPRLGGGSAFVARLDDTTFANGSQIRTVAVTGGVDITSMAAGETVIFFSAHDRMMRLPIDSGNPVDLTPTIVAPTPRLKPEITMSGNGRMAAFLYGADNATLEIYVLDAQAAAPVKLPVAPSHYEEPNYLPEGTGDQKLMLNEDGSRLFFVDALSRDESYLLDTSGVLPTLHITQDAIFQPYIGIHILPSFKGTTLVAAIGDINLMDWFKVDLTPIGGNVSNLTRTGSAAQPFPAGSIVPSALGVNGNTAIVTDVNSPANQNLRSIDLNSGASTVLFQDLNTDVVAGSSLVGAPDVFVPGPGDRLMAGDSGALIAATPPGFHISPPVGAPFFGMTVNVTSITLLPSWGLVTFYMPGAVVFGPVILDLRQVVWTRSGGLILASPIEVLHLSLGNPMRVLPLAPNAVRTIISGAGG